MFYIGKLSHILNRWKAFIPTPLRTGNQPGDGLPHFDGVILAAILGVDLGHRRQVNSGERRFKPGPDLGVMGRYHRLAVAGPHHMAAPDGGRIPAGKDGLQPLAKLRRDLGVTRPEQPGVAVQVAREVNEVRAVSGRSDQIGVLDDRHEWQFRLGH